MWALYSIERETTHVGTVQHREIEHLWALYSIERETTPVGIVQHTEI